MGRQRPGGLHRSSRRVEPRRARSTSWRWPGRSSSRRGQTGAPSKRNFTTPCPRAAGARRHARAAGGLVPGLPSDAADRIIAPRRWRARCTPSRSCACSSPRARSSWPARPIARSAIWPTWPCRRRSSRSSPRASTRSTPPTGRCSRRPPSWARRSRSTAWPRSSGTTARTSSGAWPPGPPRAGRPRRGSALGRARPVRVRAVARARGRLLDAGAARPQGAPSRRRPLFRDARRPGAGRRPGDPLPGRIPQRERGAGGGRARGAGPGRAARRWRARGRARGARTGAHVLP